MGWGTTREGLMPVSGLVSMGDACPQSQGPRPQHPTHRTAATAAQGPTPEVHGHLQSRPHLPPPGGVVSDSSPGHHPPALGLHPPASSCPLQLHHIHQQTLAAPTAPGRCGGHAQVPPRSVGLGHAAPLACRAQIAFIQTQFPSKGSGSPRGLPLLCRARGKDLSRFFLIGLIYSVVQM